MEQNFSVPKKYVVRSFFSIFYTIHIRKVALMSVLLETTLGELVIDLEMERIPKNSTNFIHLSLLKKLNNISIASIEENFLCIFGESATDLDLGSAEFQMRRDLSRKFLAPEKHERIKHSRIGTVGMVNGGQSFYITLRDGPLSHLDKSATTTIIGYVEEGKQILEKISSALCDNHKRPFNPIRIRHAVILDDEGVETPSWFPHELPSSPLETVDELLRPVDDDEDERIIREREKEAVARAREVELELMGDLPSADLRPPANVLFVCKLNPVTEDEDLKTVFARFGEIKNCEIIRDYKTGDSLQYAFVEFQTEESCNKAYVSMQNVLIDDRRIKVDFSQSVSQIWNKYRREGKTQQTVGNGRERSRSRSRRRENNFTYGSNSQYRKK